MFLNTYRCIYNNLARRCTLRSLTITNETVFGRIVNDMPVELDQLIVWDFYKTDIK